MEPQKQSPAASMATGPGVVSTGWLAANSTFEHKADQRLGAGLMASLVLHGVALAIILLAFAIAPQQTLDLSKSVVSLVFMQQPGPGGGGGGNPTPTPPKPAEIPKPKAPPPPTPIVVPVEAPPPPPTLNAPVFTPNAQSMAWTGSSSVSIQNFGGTGRGRGAGEGRGSGVGAGEGGGTGGGVYGPGNGVQDPKLVKEVTPKYTSEAMRAKIQGQVWLEVIIRKDGTVGDVRVVKSLDAVNGLDQEAIKAARQWLFQPATLRSTGEKIDYQATIELSFRIF